MIQHSRWSNSTWCLVATIMLLLLAGCASVGEKKAGIKSTSSKTGQSTAESRAPQTNQEAIQRRTEAHAHYAAAVIHELRGEENLAIEQYLLCAKNDPQNEPLVIELAQRLIASNQAEKVIPVLELAAAEPTASGLIDAWLGMALTKAGKTDAAISAFRKAISKSPRALIGYQGLAQVYITRKQPLEALRVFETAANAPGTTPGFAVDLAVLVSEAVRTKAVDPEKGKALALNLLERAAVAKPSEPFVLQKMAEAYKTLGELERAANLYVDLLRKYPPEDAMLKRLLREQLIRLYIWAGQKEKATEQLNEVLKENSTDAGAHFLLGAIAAEEKKYGQAAEYFEKAILLNEDFEPAYYELAGVRLTQGQYQLALEVLDKARTRFDRNFIVEFYTGIARSGLKQYREALASLTSAELLAKTSDPGRLNHLFYAQVASVHAGLAEAALRNNDRAEAERHFNEAQSLIAKSMEIAPANANLYLQAGSICERVARQASATKNSELATKLYAEAERYLRRCIELEPENAEALNYLGYMWAELGVNLKEAKGLIERALKIEPDNAAFLDSLAWVLFKLGQPEAALKPMLEAIAKSEKPDATLLDHLGDIYAALKRYAEARTAWTQSLQVEDNPEVRRKLESSPNQSEP